MTELPHLEVGDPIEVRWVDAGEWDGGENAWHTLEDALLPIKEITVKSIGYYLGKIKTVGGNEWAGSIVTCGSFEDTKKDCVMVAERSEIPIGCILSVEKLGEVRYVG